jgi:hypothetical protein
MSEPVSPIALLQINIVVRDMQRSVAFYRLLGVSIDEVAAEWAEWARHLVNGVAANGVRVEFDSVAFAKPWNPGLDEARLGSAGGPGRELSGHHERDRRVPAATAAASARGLSGAHETKTLRHRAQVDAGCADFVSITRLPSGSCTYATRSPHGWSIGSSKTRVPSARSSATASSTSST